MKKVSEESLSSFSKVPKLLLSKNPEIRWKNKESISREFEEEKWGSLLEISKKYNASVDLLENIMHQEKKEKLFLYEEDLYLDKPINISKLFLKESVDALKEIYIDFNCQSLIEIGAGYGRLLIPLADALKKEKPKKVLGTDFTKVGKNKLFYDVIYEPCDTEFSDAARITGNTYENGLNMFLFQAQKAFNIWHDINPIINDDLIEFLKN